MSVAAPVASFVIGVSLMAAPDVLGYADPVRSVHHVIGPIVASLSTIAMWQVVRAVVRANLASAAAITVAAFWADTVPIALLCAGAGALLGALALAPIHVGDRYAGGWMALVRR